VRVRRLAIVLVAAATVAGGCSLVRRPPKIEEQIGRIAVLPIEREERADARSQEGADLLAPGAERVVTAAIYEVLSSDPKWRFVSDVVVSDALREVDPGNASLLARSRSLAQAVGADAVLFGSVSRYRERVGARYGARGPAAVSFSLQLLHAPSGKIVWRGSFEGTQQSLSENLFNWWQFWRGGPRWFTAEEFTLLAMERTLDDLAARLY
jgi:hypothetical protein